MICLLPNADALNFLNGDIRLKLRPKYPISIDISRIVRTLPPSFVSFILKVRVGASPRSTIIPAICDIRWYLKWTNTTSWISKQTKYLNWMNIWVKWIITLCGLRSCPIRSHRNLFNFILNRQDQLGTNIAFMNAEGKASINDRI